MLMPEIPVMEHGPPIPGSGNKPGMSLQVSHCSGQEDSHLSEQGDFLSLLKTAVKTSGDQLCFDTVP